MKFVVASDDVAFHSKQSTPFCYVNFTRSWGTPVGTEFAAAQEGDAVMLGFVVVDAVDAPFVELSGGPAVCVH